MESINTLRSLLVAGAVFSALIAAFFGRWAVVAILAVGVGAHAGLWVHLSRSRRAQGAGGTAAMPDVESAP